ncbi:MAG: hypothetical protein Tsb0015_16480 [Simkaniaceae bacterium]
MPILHIGNTNFEWELSHPAKVPLEKSFEFHKNFIQLSFLPLLYANEEDYVYATYFPSEEYLAALTNLGFSLPKLISKETIRQGFSVESWGSSQIVKQFAKQHKLTYNPPDWEIMKQIASKEYSFMQSPMHEGKVLHEIEEAIHWILKTKGKKVLKSCYGFSGQGHYHIEENLNSADEIPPSIYAFLKNEIEMHKRPVIAEPWVDRKLDFSSQWNILPDGKIQFLGTTLLKTSPKGVHLENIAAENPRELFLTYHSQVEEHLDFAKRLLKEITMKGYFGHVGLDAMIYQKNNRWNLQPLVEINPRKNFGLIALLLREKFMQRFLPLRYLPKEQIKNVPLLPFSAGECIFKKQLEMELDLQSVVP